MGDGDKRESWADYLRRMTDRPGWSVARLARDSGIHRATIFKWMAGKGGANVASVRAIAEALGDDPANALRAAGNMPGAETEAMDPDVQIILRRLTDPTVSDAEKDAIRTALKYLAEVAERADTERPGRVVRRRKAS
ncbi:helix-turn-helix transcriptional regulator [Micromonospora aurantiaca]|uniref:helix-turn-helix domain-containing protein n=1 Tax=Micromonospora aurantiaca (nom. illeg.) TaxID=47850 RepID=UPI0034352C83